MISYALPAAGAVGLALWAFSGDSDAASASDAVDATSSDPAPAQPLDYETGLPAAILGGASVTADPQANLQALLAAIRQFESSGKYNVLVGGSTFVQGASFPSWSGYQGSHAAGAYQFEPGTWAWVAKNTGCSDMSNDSQDTNAAWLANYYAGPAIARGDMDTVCLQLQSQWESMKVKGEAAYAQAYSDAGGALA